MSLLEILQITKRKFPLLKSAAKKFEIDTTLKNCRFAGKYSPEEKLYECLNPAMDFNHRCKNGFQFYCDDYFCVNPENGYEKE